MTEECLTGKRVDEFDPADWWGATDGEILKYLRQHGTVALGELCEELGLPRVVRRRFLPCWPAKAGCGSARWSRQAEAPISGANRAYRPSLARLFFSTTYTLLSYPPKMVQNPGT
jgi:hypothetical protein